MPGVAELGNTTDDYASEVNVRWSDGGGYFTATASDPVAADLFGPVEYATSIADRGAMTQSEAQSVADAILAAGRARPGFNSTFGPHSFQLLSVGGAPAALNLVRAGDVVRVHGIVDDYRNLTGAPYLDVVASEVARSQDEQTVQIKPLGSVSTDLAAVVEELFAA